jgi:DNA replication and repair protein RecF
MPGPGPVVLTGPNGAGKTNLLEAVSLLAPGKGIRRAKIRDLDRVDPALGKASCAWAVAARIETPHGPVDLGTGRDPEGERRRVRVDGIQASGQAALGDHFSTVWLTPQMDRLFQDSAGERRRFLDRLIYGFEAAHAGRITGYEKALRQRARLLKDGPQDDSWLSALEAQMIERGIAISAGPGLYSSGRPVPRCRYQTCRGC